MMNYNVSFKINLFIQTIFMRFYALSQITYCHYILSGGFFTNLKRVKMEKKNQEIVSWIPTPTCCTKR